MSDKKNRDHQQQKALPRLFRAAQNTRLPPVEKWNPPFWRRSGHGDQTRRPVLSSTPNWPHGAGESSLRSILIREDDDISLNHAGRKGRSSRSKMPLCRHSISRPIAAATDQIAHVPDQALGISALSGPRSADPYRTWPPKPESPRPYVPHPPQPEGADRPETFTAGRTGSHHEGWFGVMGPAAASSWHQSRRAKLPELFRCAKAPRWRRAITELPSWARCETESSRRQRQPSLDSAHRRQTAKGA